LAQLHQRFAKDPIKINTKSKFNTGNLALLDQGSEIIRINFNLDIGERTNILTKRVQLIVVLNNRNYIFWPPEVGRCLSRSRKSLELGMSYLLSMERKLILRDSNGGIVQ
jgi:hypothetical protein